LPENEIDRIEDSIRQAAATESNLDNAIRARNSLRVGRDRSLIVIMVFVVYVGMIATIILYLGYRAYAFQEKVFDSLTEIIKIAVVPIVTLVIGYYFGTEKSEKS
jgi:hypothetical protein